MPSTARKLRTEIYDSEDEDNENVQSHRKKRKIVRKPLSAGTSKSKKSAATVKASDFDCLESLIMFKPVSPFL